LQAQLGVLPLRSLAMGANRTLLLIFTLIIN
jgi:hypothetical protein